MKSAFHEALLSKQVSTHSTDHHELYVKSSDAINIIQLIAYMMNPFQMPLRYQHYYYLVLNKKVKEV